MLKKFTLKAHNPSDAKNTALSHRRQLPFRQADLNIAVYRTVSVRKRLCYICLVNTPISPFEESKKRSTHFIHYKHSNSDFFSTLNTSVTNTNHNLYSTPMLNQCRAVLPAPDWQ